MSHPSSAQPNPITWKSRLGPATWGFTLGNQNHVLELRRYYGGGWGSSSRVYINNALIPATPQAQYHGAAFQFNWYGHSFIITVEGQHAPKWDLFLDGERVD